MGVFASALIVCNSQQEFELVCNEVKRAGYNLKCSPGYNQAAVDAALERPWDLVMLCEGGQGFFGVERLAVIRARQPDAIVIVIAGKIGEERVVEIVKSGADGFVTRDHLPWLKAVLDRETGMRRRRRSVPPGSVKESANARLKKMLATCPFILYTAKSHGDYGITFISDNVKNILGWEPSKFTENSLFWAERIHPNDVMEVFESFSALARNGQTSRMYRFKDASGSWKWLRDELALMQEEGFDGQEIVGTLLDVTVQKDAEEFLVDTEERYRTLFENSLDLIFFMDFTGRLLSVNPAAMTLFGYSSEEIRKMNLSDLVSKEEYESALKSIEHLRADRGGLPLKVYHVRKKDGSMVPIETRMSLCRQRCAPHCVQCVAQNINEKLLVKESGGTQRRPTV